MCNFYIVCLSVVLFGGGSRRGARGPLKGVSLDRKPSLRRAELPWLGAKERLASQSIAVSVGPIRLAVAEQLS